MCLCFLVTILHLYFLNLIKPDQIPSPPTPLTLPKIKRKRKKKWKQEHFQLYLCFSWYLLCNFIPSFINPFRKVAQSPLKNHLLILGPRVRTLLPSSLLCASAPITSSHLTLTTPFFCLSSSVGGGIFRGNRLRNHQCSFRRFVIFCWSVTMSCLCLCAVCFCCCCSVAICCGDDVVTDVLVFLCHLAVGVCKYISCKFNKVNKDIQQINQHMNINVNEVKLIARYLPASKGSLQANSY